MTTDLPDWLTKTPAVDAVHKEPPLNYQWSSMTEDELRGIRHKLIQSILQIIMSAFTGLIVPGDQYTQLQSWSQNIPGVMTIVDNIVTRLFGWTGSGFTHDQSAEALASQHNSAVSNASQIADIWAALAAAAGGSGVVASDAFERTSSSSLGSNWSETYGSGGGHWATDGHTAYWNEAAFAGNRESLCRWLGTPTVSTSDYQTITAVLNSAPENQLITGRCGHNDLIGRCSSDGLNYIRLRIQGDGNWRLDKSIAGTLTLMASGTMETPGGGATISLICGDKASSTPRFFTAKINTLILASGSFSDTTSNVGSSYRGWGFGGRAEASVFDAVQWNAGALVGWLAQDT